MSEDVVFVSDDLMFAPRVAGQAQAAGWQLRTVASPAAAIELVHADAPRLLVIDLEVAGLNISDMMSELPESARPPILAFGPHVHRQRLETARDAGCDMVVSRGRFSAELPALIAECLGNAGR